MKFLRFLLRFSLSLIIAIILICIGLWFTGNSHLIKAVRSTYLVGKTAPTIADYTKFENRVVEASAAQKWPLDDRYNKYELNSELKKEIESWETVALLIVKDKKILFEKYWNDYSETSLSNSFSMAKSLTSLAIGAAIQEGKIKSVDQKVGDFIPEFKKGKKAAISIKHLLQMCSGIDFGESYGDPFGFMAKVYYGENLYELTVNKPVKHQPGKVWKYQGGNTLLLSFILEKACGKNLSDYFSAHFWKPIGAVNNALWTLNKEGGKEKAYCCFYSNARDFAKIGQLVLDSGSWNEQPLISKSYFIDSFVPVMLKNEEGKIVDYYASQWWIGKYKDVPFYYARGIQGQYIAAIPKWDMVLVRLGHKRHSKRGAIVPEDFFSYLKVAEDLK